MAVMRLESSIDFKGTSGCKAITGAQIYPVRVECKLEPLDMRNKHTKLLGYLKIYSVKWKVFIV